jgi:putative restriction endonuclease
MATNACMSHCSYGTTGGLTADAYELISKDPRPASELAQELLDAHFPASMHEDILAAVGLDVAFTVERRRKRNPEFRQRVLTAYEFRCAPAGGLG